MVTSGDHDMTVPFLATQAWIRSLNYSIIDDWRPWMMNDQIAGYTLLCCFSWSFIFSSVIVSQACQNSRKTIIAFLLTDTRELMPIR